MDPSTLGVLQLLVGGAVVITPVLIVGRGVLLVVHKVKNTWLHHGAVVQPNEQGEWPAVSSGVVGGPGDPRHI